MGYVEPGVRQQGETAGDSHPDRLPERKPPRTGALAQAEEGAVQGRDRRYNVQLVARGAAPSGDPEGESKQGPPASFPKAAPLSAL